MPFSFTRFLYKRIRLTAKAEVPLVYMVWFALAIIALAAEIARGLSSIDNYLIFRGVFYHVWEQKNLFDLYPTEYASFNNYGPAFSVIIAPFAVLPVYLGCFLWGMANAGALFAAIRMLPVKMENKLLILWVACLEMMTSLHNVQFNPMLTACFIFAFVFTLRGKDWLATLFIAIAILTKLYGAAGLVFFLFSENKKSFLLSFAVWMIVLFALPMLFSSAGYIIDTYESWYHQIIKRNQQNIDNSRNAGMQDISVPGMIRRIFNYYNLQDLRLIAAAGLLFALPLLRLKQLRQLVFQLHYLALVLISVVIFSSAAESPTFVIAVTGAAIWLILQARPFQKGVVLLLAVLFVLTILSPTDLVPAYVREHFIRAYSLKALPCFLVWCFLVYTVWRTDFTKPAAI